MPLRPPIYTFLSTPVHLHPSLPLQLPNLLTRLRLPHALRLDLLARILRHYRNVPRLLPRRRIVARRPPLWILYRLSRCSLGILRAHVLHFVDFGAGVAFVEVVGIELDAFFLSEGLEKGCLFLCWGVLAGGPGLGVVELGGHGCVDSNMEGRR